MLDEVEKYIIIFHEGNIVKDIYHGVGKSFNKCFLIRQTISKGLKEKFFKITIDYYLPLFSQLINFVIDTIACALKNNSIYYGWSVENYMRFCAELINI